MYRAFLSPGERGTIIIIATDRKQARVIFRYVRALLNNVAMLSSTLVRCASRIGIDRRAKDITPDLRDYIEGRATGVGDP